LSVALSLLLPSPAMPGLNLPDDAASVSLVTSSIADSVQYRLLQLNPDMVPLFEANIDDSSRGTKRHRDDSDDDEGASR
jgi:hypothetical protein